MAITALSSCKQGNTSPTETVNAVRNYDYADAMGRRLTIQNSVPKGGGYIGADGKRYPYVVFYTQVTNGTLDPIELNIDLPSGSFEFPLSSGNNMEIFLPSDTLNMDKISLMDYGLPITTYLEKGMPRSHALKRTILPEDTTAFYVVLLSSKGVNGTLRTWLSLKGEKLIYTIAAYESIPGHPLMEEKEITCGSMDVKNFVRQE